MLLMKTRKRKTVEEIELQNHESIITFGKKENYKYLEILEADTIKQAETKKKTPGHIEYSGPFLK